MLEMAEDEIFVANWVLSVASNLEKGLHLNIIHELNRPLREMLLALEAWIPLYMTGRITPYYLPKKTTELYHHLLFTSGSVALAGECIAGKHDHGRYELTTDPRELSYFKTRSKDLLRRAKPLMDIYPAERWEAFRFAMLEHGLEVDPSLYVVGNWTFEGGRMAARALLQRAQLPTAVFAASDMMAAGVMEELRSAGLRVPDDISVVGYDNLDIDVLLSPPLSSATVDFKHMCEVAFEHLKMVMEKGDRERDHFVIRMPATLIRRGSVAGVCME
jgi:hypothetical protein